jgi:hypothetical protein
MQKIQISNHSLSGLNRKISVSKFEIDFELSEIHFYYIIYFFNSNGDSLDSFKEPLVGSKLTASNDMKVDEQGNYLQPDENGSYPEGAVGEFDFWLAFIQNDTFTYAQVFAQVIAKADSTNRFD